MHACEKEILKRVANTLRLDGHSVNGMETEASKEKTQQVIQATRKNLQTELLWDIREALKPPAIDRVAVHHP